MNQKELSQEDSLRIIQGMIALAKSKINDSGFHFLLWGCLVIAASISQYFMIQSGMGNESNWVWFIMGIIGAPIAIVYERRKDRKGKTTGKFDKMYGYLWMGFGITLFVTIYVSIAHRVNPIPFILLLIGLATFVSGAIYQFAPLIIGAIVFWITAAVCHMFDQTDQLLVYSAAIFIGYIIPGILLWKRSKSAVHV
jgi:hypothetical protein